MFRGNLHPMWFLSLYWSYACLLFILLSFSIIHYCIRCPAPRPGECLLCVTQGSVHNSFVFHHQAIAKGWDHSTLCKNSHNRISLSWYWLPSGELCDSKHNATCSRAFGPCQLLAAAVPTPRMFICYTVWHSEYSVFRMLAWFSSTHPFNCRWQMR